MKGFSMQFKLKNVAYSPRLSQETNAFRADLYINGKLAGDVCNEGRGGPTCVHLYKLSREEESQVTAWVAKQPAKQFEATESYKAFSVPVSLETIADDLFESWHEQKHGEAAQVARWCTKAVVFRFKGDPPGQYQRIPLRTGERVTKALLAAVENLYGDRLERVFNPEPRT